ncbi:hypothetical protein HERIO_1323 [Hepatospora eriocheir]|uniref:Uncharacterized protein n=1 Tax=Hepatospora eriocheir TaxID=1081669 RepID=A0A1X0QAM7_9MICR|nr:hypothetical protein HERIO_1323 [Hepatospora eriocheir]
MNTREIKETDQTFANRLLTNPELYTEEDTERLIKLLKEDVGSLSTADSEKVESIMVRKEILVSAVKNLIEHKLNNPNTLYDAVLDLLYINPNNPTDINTLSKVNTMKRNIFELIVDIVYKVNYTNQKLETFVTEKMLPDEFSINFTPIIRSSFKCYELTLLNQLELKDHLVKVIETYQRSMRSCVKEKIISNLVPKLKEETDIKTKRIIFKIFFLINNQPHDDLLEIKYDNSNEYIGFISTLIHDEKSTTIAYQKLNHYYRKLTTALNNFVQYSKVKEKAIKPEDQELIHLVLLTVSKIVKFKKEVCLKFIGILQDVLKYPSTPEIKAVTYDILSEFLVEKEIFIQLNINCKKEIQEELDRKSFILLPSVIKFINLYEKRQVGEKKLLENGYSIGSPYLTVDEPVDDYKMLALKSEDFKTMKECLSGSVSTNMLKMCSSSIRNACLKNSKMIEELINYQIRNNVAVDDIILINLIISYPNLNFFKYARLFTDFSFYIRKEVLNRISEDIKEGITWLNECYTREVGEFVIINCIYFNGLLEKNRDIQPVILKLYSKILDDNISRVRILIKQEKEENSAVDTLYVYDDQDLVNEDFFLIFSKQLIYSTFYKQGQDNQQFILTKSYASSGVINYIKTKIVCKLDYEKDVNYLITNLVDIDELIGYLKIVDSDKQFNYKVRNPTVLTEFNCKNSSYFLKNFKKASQLEKFLLFFSIDEMNLQIESLIKAEVLCNLKTTNEVYLEMCLLQLFRCSDLDGMIKILEKNFSRHSLFAKLALHNLIKGGKYLNNNIIEFADKTTEARLLFMAYYNNIWDRDKLTQIIDSMDLHSNHEINNYLSEVIKTRF